MKTVTSLKKATLINAVSRYTNVIIGLLFTAILARILSPEDYGIVAVVTVFTNFFVIFVDMGIGTGIIQNKELNYVEINHIFGITFYIGTFVAAIFCLLGYPISIFYNNNIYISICLLLSLSLLFNALNMVPSAVLMKNKLFIQVGIRNVIIPIFTNIIAVVLAVIGYGFYALVIQSIFAAFISLVWNCITARKYFDLKFTFKIDFTGFNKIRNYSTYQFFFTLVNYFSRNLDNLLTSHFFGEAALGFYDKAYKLTLYPLNMLTHVITPALHPILSEYQDNLEYILEQYLKILKILSLIGAFIVPFCFSSSKEVIYIMFGSKWDFAIPCFNALSLSIWAQMLASSSGSIFQSTNNTKLMLKISLINTTITIFAIFIGIYSKSVVNMSLAVSMAYIITFFLTFYTVMNIIFNKKNILFIKSIASEMVFIICSIIIFEVFNSIIFINNILISLIIKLTLLCCVYFLFLLITKQYKIIFMLIKH